MDILGILKTKEMSKLHKEVQLETRGHLEIEKLLSGVEKTCQGDKKGDEQGSHLEIGSCSRKEVLVL